MSKTDQTDTNIIEASRTTAHLAVADPATGGTPKMAKRRRLRRMITGIALAAAATGALAALPSGVTAASASTLQSVELTPYSSFFLMLDVSGASQSPGAGVIQYWSNQGANQKWDILPRPDGTDWIINVNSQQCLTTDGVAGDPVYQEPCNPYAPNQEWWTGIQTNGNAYPIQSAYSGLVLDVYGNSPWPGAVVDTWYWNGGNNQYFTAIQD
jgi:hypothetical protein